MEIPNKMYVAKTPYGAGRVTRPLHFISVLCKIFARSSGGCRIRSYENRERCNFSAFYPQHTDNPKSSRLIPYKNFSCRKKAEQNQFRIKLSSSASLKNSSIESCSGRAFAGIPAFSTACAMSGFSIPIEDESELRRFFLR